MSIVEDAALLGGIVHCDQRVLHAPGECRWCDERPHWQALRRVWGIAYTGHAPGPGEMSCPSDFVRGLRGADAWPGNLAHNVDCRCPICPA